MSVVIPVYFDYASSLCFIASVIGAQLEAALAIELDWRPVAIAAQYPALRKGPPLGDEAYAKITRVAAETGVAVRVPERWLDSRAALEGAFVARDRGRFRDYHQRVFGAAFVDGEDIGDRRVLTRIAAAAGLPMGDFMMAIATRAGAARLAANTADARRHQVLGYPTFVLGEFLLAGIQPIETMRLLFQRHVERHAQCSLH